MIADVWPDSMKCFLVLELDTNHVGLLFFIVHRERDRSPRGSDYIPLGGSTKKGKGKGRGRGRGRGRDEDDERRNERTPGKKGQKGQKGKGK